MTIDRNNVWAPVGLDLTGSRSVDEALKRAELDFTVERQNIFDKNGNEIPRYFMNRRSDNGNVLGIVSGKYNIVQNRDAFDFMENLIPEGMQFERGGVWHNGSAVWVEAKLPGEYDILGDKVDSHVVFINAHDGKASVKICLLPTRLVCSNQLALAIGKADRKWSMIHSSKVDEKIEEAKQTLGLADRYMIELSNEINILASKKFSKDQFMNIVDRLYPINETDSNRKQFNAMQTRTAIMNAYEAPDVANFSGTAYAPILAATDFFSHQDPQRATKEFYDARFMKMAGGNAELNAIVDAVYAEVA